MNIGIDIRCLMERELTGVGEYTFYLLKHLFEVDSTNQYYLFYNSRQKVNKYIPKFPKDNVHYCEFKMSNKVLNLTLKIFSHPKLDQIIIHKYKSSKIDLFLFPNISFFKTNCPYIITAHDLSFEIFPEFLSFKRKLWHWFVNPNKLFQQADQVISVSKNTKQDLIDIYKIAPKKIQTIYSGISQNYRILNPKDPKFKKIKNKYKLPEKFILFLGTIEPRKNLTSLIKAFNLFHQEHPEYSLVIAGKPGWHYKKIIKQQSKNIIFTKYIKDSEKRYFYNLASMFVYPSFYEGFGFPPIEAMACGCPVITSNNSSMSEICQQAALLINPTDTNDLYSAMKQMTNSKLAKQYIAAGLQKSKDIHWYQTAQDYLQEIKKFSAKS
ncbi:glycosyltransferase family 4 protein [Candidatus Falkowbacteria bacterium]|jgi:glycosyltransferase involved in cell wall biosynthesis|nr:glycosyltransferase family 4 protein [Candidatus Falkowbacteria bacterium]MBT5503713.1 glycosyltransferase family 4 protein [Candidatus Falkowbacteria bacterium]MBT6573807.1 glycosyltransferase family 4 protein [Candidatus Falkowbacteria bacterium]MBT7348765.1 glycosyltransferase family 4 protein [Candidatus Falkowbacteria bacterium]MBT7500555.1 glycosyltransferase family 4 protein [Candidatus Falkowbacteria bacterium]